MQHCCVRNCDKHSLFAESCHTCAAGHMHFMCLSVCCVNHHQLHRWQLWSPGPAKPMDRRPAVSESASCNLISFSSAIFRFTVSQSWGKKRNFIISTKSQVLKYQTWGSQNPSTLQISDISNELFVAELIGDIWISLISLHDISLRPLEPQQPNAWNHHWFQPQCFAQSWSTKEMARPWKTVLFGTLLSSKSGWIRNNFYPPSAPPVTLSVEVKQVPSTKS